jgi:hypothetical protein
MSKRIPSSPGERDLTAKAIEAREEAEKNGSRPPPNRRTEEGGKTAAGGEYLQLSLFQRTQATRVAELPAHAWVAHGDEHCRSGTKPADPLSPLCRRFSATIANTRNINRPEQVPLRAASNGTKMA